MVPGLETARQRLMLEIEDRHMRPTERYMAEVRTLCGAMAEATRAGESLDVERWESGTRHRVAAAIRW
jgi:hypothetical protein